MSANGGVCLGILGKDRWTEVPQRVDFRAGAELWVCVIAATEPFQGSPRWGRRPSVARTSQRWATAMESRWDSQNGASRERWGIPPINLLAGKDAGGPRGSDALSLHFAAISTSRTKSDQNECVHGARSGNLSRRSRYSRCRVAGGDEPRNGGRAPAARPAAPQAEKDEL